MGSDTPILAFDTSAAHCAAALLFEDRIVTHVEEMGRGQAERLMPLLEELLMREDLHSRDVKRIAVGTGPGNFTGIRISVSAARGLALGLGIPTVGVSCLAALRAMSRSNISAIPGPRETAYLQRDDDPPEIVQRDAVPHNAEWLGDPGQLVASIARIARTVPENSPAPAPLYLKPADAAPSRDASPLILDDT